VLWSLVLALALALEPPAAPTARVNDYAGLLQPNERQRLESLIAERERATGTQVAVAIFRSLDGGSVEDFSIKLAEKWRIGQKGLDNGVIVVVFVDDRKVRLEVGYGLEPVIPDIVAGRIISETIAPRFRERRYAAGLEAAVQDIYARVDAGPGAPGHQATKPVPRPSWPITGLLVVGAIIVIVLGMEANRSRRFVGRRGYTAGRGGWSGPIIFPGPGWGGGWGGRRGDGGGFSGGGGRFGGGGASGSW
jgi:uncharacterized protein